MNCWRQLARYKKAKGFSLAEVLIATILLSMCVVAMSKIFSVGMFVSGDAENINLALNIAQSKMEEIKGKDFLNLTDSTFQQHCDFSDFRVAVDVTEKKNPMRVNVIVAWDVKGGEKNITLSTLVAEY